MEKKLKFSQLKGANIEPLLDPKDSEEIGRGVVDTYENDKQSRFSWEEKMKGSTDLALQVVKNKTSPWRNASNVKFPLLTIACLQFASRCYPTLVKAPDLVKFRVQGTDKEGQKAARAGRISAHMSYQLLEQDEAWEEDQDRAFFALPILGCIFKKTYFDPVKGHNCSKLVLPKDLVVHYYAKSIECERKTEVITLSEREVKERVLRKVYSDKELLEPEQEAARAEDERQGITPPPDDRDRPRTILEQHCYLDLDGDGYPEPYVVTVDKTSKTVLRVVHRFGEVVSEQSIKADNLRDQLHTVKSNPPPVSENPTQQEIAQLKSLEAYLQGVQQQIKELEAEEPDILRIQAVEHYTKYTFIPSPDGGFYDLGFGALLGPLNSSVDTIVNQLIDSGSLQNSQSGFIGKGARLKGGALRFSPFEWKKVDSTGSQIRDNILPLPVNAPSPVLFNLLGLLIEYTERVASVTDANTGQDVGQNTPAYNMSAMLEQGLQVFNGIFKRVYRSFRAELRKHYDLNAIYLNEREYFEYLDADRVVYRQDYTADKKDLIPAADPNAFSNKEKQMKWAMIAQRAAMVPGYDPIVIEKGLLESMDTPNVAELYPLIEGENGPEWKIKPPPDPEFQMKAMEEQRRTLEAQHREKLGWAEYELKAADTQASVLLKMAQADATKASVVVEKINLLLDDIKDKRKHITERAKIDAKERTSNGVA